MTLQERIYKIRSDLKLSQAGFAELFGVSRQTVQKWESGDATPELSKLIELSRRFDISLDTLILGRDMRAMEEMDKKDRLSPNYSGMHNWELYVSALADEYQQCLDEGLDIEAYKDIIFAVDKLPKGDIKKKFGDVIFEAVRSAVQRADYRYTEPSDLEGIRALCRPYPVEGGVDIDRLTGQMHGAWTGRVCGCLLGKTVEGIHTDELIPLLKETGNYPMYRYIRKSDLAAVDLQKYRYPLVSRPYADEVTAMPADDDTNYTVLAQRIIEDYGRGFTPYDVASAWLRYQPKDAYCTAERVAFCNFVKGYQPPDSAIYKNPYREWIGAQIRTDYYGYINPGDPATAAEMAWRDASISHVKNGIYGAMFVAAMLAVAAVTDNMEDIILAGLGQIPYTSRLYEDVMQVVDAYRTGMSQKDCFKLIHRRYDEHTGYGWCHTNSNAMIVAAALLYGQGDYGKSICMAVETGFDTDCNGATVGSIWGMAHGIRGIDSCWTDPINGIIETNIFGLHRVQIDSAVEKTLAHIE